LLRGPQGTLYGRNSMGGVLSLRTLSPSDAVRPSVRLEYGTANTLRLGFLATSGENAFSATFRHGDGFFPNTYKEELCDPYDGLSLRWKWEKPSGKGNYLSNVLYAGLSREGGFAYGLYENGVQHDVAYNDEGSYARLSVMEGFKLRHRADRMTVEGAASLQLLCDDMHMDQDYTPKSIFTLRQLQHSGAGTFELSCRRNDTKAAWQPVTGVFTFFRLNHSHSPVQFKRQGIESLILDNANSHIPEEIGFLSISDQSFPVESDFLIGSWNAAVFHESALHLGKWLLTAGVRLDYEGGWMDYDCETTLHYRFQPYMVADKEYTLPYRGDERHSRLVLLPKLSALYEAAPWLSLYLSASKGYRAGGFNTQIFSDILQNLTMNGIMKDLGVHLEKKFKGISASATEYDPEYAWNFEAGSRIRKGRLELEASVFHMDVTSQQLTTFPPGQNIGRMMTNAGRSRIRGVETSAEWRGDDFHGELGWSFCDARFVSYDDGNADYSGKHVPYAPAHTLYLGAGYTFHFGKCALSADAGLRGAGPFWWNEDNTRKEDLQLRLDARLALSYGRWELYLRGTDLTDNDGRCFYFKSIGNEFFASVKPRILITGLSIKL
ncbi:MAG: TonB-dependent receptor, partial [Bacteroidales bacterium]|nr:TonB-dependent receptor [Bacteroidales bacterium]